MSEAEGAGGAKVHKTVKGSPNPQKGQDAGSLEDARRVLWTALKRAEKALKARDHSTALKGVHAVSQCAASYARLVEVSELEQRIKALEERDTE